MPRTLVATHLSAAHVAGVAPAMLAISLLFGAGQVAVGVALLVRGARRGRWRRLGIYVTMVLGAWFVCSGAVELIVSSLAASSEAWGQPAPAALARFRGGADVGLIWASVALVVLACLYPIWRWRLPRHQMDHPRMDSWPARDDAARREEPGA